LRGSDHTFEQPPCTAIESPSVASSVVWATAPSSRWCEVCTPICSLEVDEMAVRCQ